MMVRSHPFDALAADYDTTFGGRPATRLLRDRVHDRLRQLVSADNRVLEIGCGTGDDAVFLAGLGAAVTATDASAAMIAKTRQKVTASGFAEKVQVRIMSAEDLSVDAEYDFVFSNFGAINCLADLTDLAQRLADNTKPGARLMFTTMGRPCLFEILYFGLKGDRRWSRRLKRTAPAQLSSGGEMDVTYHAPREVDACLAPWFARRRIWGLGVLWPTSEAYHLVEKWPRLFGLLARLESVLERTPGFRRVGDHYVIEYERVGSTPSRPG